MAVVINVQAFRNTLPLAVRDAAGALLRRGGVGELELVDGGVQAVVRDRGAAYQPWVGIVDRALTAECECHGDGEWCVHAVAVALNAFEHDVRWSAAATPPSIAQRPVDHAEYVTAVERLAPRQLTTLVVDQAVEDRVFASKLLGAAGMLAASDLRRAVDDFDRVLDEVANVTSGRRWEIHDIEDAGHRLVAEVAVLCAYPASVEVLDRLEKALLVWDELSAHLIDAYRIRRTDPEQIGGSLTRAHAEACERLGLGPPELVKRLNELVSQCDHETVDLDAYVDLVGDRVNEVVRSARRW